MNNFGSMTCDEKQLDALHKKYALLDVCQKLLSSYISSRLYKFDNLKFIIIEVSEWEIPKVTLDQEKILVC